MQKFCCLMAAARWQQSFFDGSVDHALGVGEFLAAVLGKVGVQNRSGDGTQGGAAAALLDIDGDGNLWIVRRSEAEEGGMAGAAGVVLSGTGLGADGDRIVRKSLACGALSGVRGAERHAVEDGVHGLVGDFQLTDDLRCIFLEQLRVVGGNDPL